MMKLSAADRAFCAAVRRNRERYGRQLARHFCDVVGCYRRRGHAGDHGLPPRDAQRRGRAWL